MKVAAAVPIKSFARAKRRLRARFSQDEVEQIQRTLLADVLHALECARRVDHVVVLTGDEDVAHSARELGAQVRLRRPDPGLNPSIEQATLALRDAGYDGLVVLLGDLPLLRGCDIDAVIEAGERAPVVGIPSMDGGTALLFCRPPGRLPARFGPESFDAHCAAARELGTELYVYDAIDPLARTDLDTPEDAQRLAASSASSTTCALLRGLLA